MAQDYILRMIQQIGAMLAGILARKQRGELVEAVDEVEKVCLQTVGLPLVVIKQSTPEAVAELLEAGGGIRHGRAILLAELLLQDAGLAEMRGNPPAALISYQHAFHLLTDSIATLNPDEQHIFRAKLDDIGAKLRDLGSGRADP